MTAPVADPDPVDVAVIGAGVVGCAIARELSAAGASVCLVEARCDLGDGTSKANTAILHTGFDASPGTLESRLVARGYELLSAYAARAGIAVEATGAILVAWTDEELDALPGLQDKAVRNGYVETALLPAAGVYAAVPDLGPGVRGGLSVPGESIIDPWSVTLAYANDAVAAGATLLCNRRVTGMRQFDDVTILETSGGDVAASWVVNAAGLGADGLDRMFGHDRFTVTPRRGELIVFDKLARPMAPVIVLPVPSSRGKGVLVSPTIFGNVMVGPTAEDLDDPRDTSTSEAGLAYLREKLAAIMPALLTEEVTATYAGLRAATEHADYVIEADGAAGYVLVGGIRSTGLTASLAIAEHVAGLLDGLGARFTGPPVDLPVGRVPNLGEAYPRPYADATRIAEDPAYGTVVCFCERVTLGEVRDALASAIPPGDLDGLRRRTRVAMGRCQGFFCGAEVTALFEAGGAG